LLFGFCTAYLAFSQSESADVIINAVIKKEKGLEREVEA
jgi:hypothetical protein